jgi:hypothetical protein
MADLSREKLNQGNHVGKDDSYKYSATFNKGHTGTSHSAHCSLSSEVKNVLALLESEHLGPQNVSLVERLYLLCPLLGGSIIIGGSTFTPALHK